MGPNDRMTECACQSWMQVDATGIGGCTGEQGCKGKDLGGGPRSAEIGGWRRLPKRLGSFAIAIEAGTWREGDSGWAQAERPGGGGFGTRPWWLALLACGGAYWPLAFEPSAMTSRHPYYCGHPHCRGHPPSLGGESRMQLLPMASSPDGLIMGRGYLPPFQCF